MVRLFINGEDALSNYGVSLGEGAMTALMTPVPNKAYLENKSAVQNGKQVLITNNLPALMDERDVSLTINVRGKSQEDMLNNYRLLCSVLAKGAVDIATDFEEGVVYHFVYLSCQQLQSFFQRSAKFVVKFNEPNPSNRV